MFPTAQVSKQLWHFTHLYSCFPWGLFALHRILVQEKLHATLFIHTMDCKAEYVKLCLSANKRSISIIMYSLFCESLNKSSDKADETSVIH